MKFSALASAGFLVLSLAVRLPAQDTGSVGKPASPSRHAPAAEEGTTPLAALLAEYGKLLGKDILTDNTVNPNSTVVLADLGGIATPQRTSLIGKALFLNNYTLVDADKNTVMVLGPGKNPRSVGVPLYTRPDELPTEERAFSYLFRLEHRDPVEVSGILQQFIPPGNNVNFTADEHGHTVTATAPTSIMRAVLKLVAAMEATGKTAE